MLNLKSLEDLECLSFEIIKGHHFLVLKTRFKNFGNSFMITKI